jgi:Actinobacteria/chloroflexi VLRF1 release factor
MRFPGWIASFAVRHGVPASGGSAGPDGRRENSLTLICDQHIVTFTAPDGAVAECHPPFPESLAWPASGGAPAPTEAGPGSDPAAIARSDPAAIATVIAEHAAAPRAVGVLLVRLGGYAAGVFAGYPPALADAKTGSRPVHGRSAAGGWSQHRFARRRENQAAEALDAAAAAAVLVFGRSVRLDAVVLGGDKRAVAGLREDPRLAPYLAIATERFLTVPDPRRAVLEAAPKGFLAVKIRLTEP